MELVAQPRQQLGRLLKLVARPRGRGIEIGKIRPGSAVPKHAAVGMVLSAIDTRDVTQMASAGVMWLLKGSCRAGPVRLVFEEPLVIAARRSQQQEEAAQRQWEREERAALERHRVVRSPKLTC